MKTALLLLLGVVCAQDAPAEPVSEPAPGEGEEPPAEPSLAGGYTD